MRIFYILLIGLMLLTTVVVADEPKLISSSYTSSKESFDIIGMIKGWLGYEAQPERVYVTIEGRVVAELPKDSKFIGVPIHDTCLEYQYGTDGWYDCEMMIK